MTTAALKTTAQAISDSGIDSTLIRAVVRAIGRDAIQDVNAHGIDGGFSGFIYTADTVAFFKRHRKAICSLVSQAADDMGETAVDMVCRFNCLAGRDSSQFDEFRPSVARCIYGGRTTDDDDVVMNALAWFAAEEVCRAFES